MCRKTILLLLIGLVAQAAAQDIRISPYTSLRMPESNAIAAMAFMANNKILVVGDDAGTIGCWDLEKKILLRTARLDERPLFLAAVSDRAYAAVDGTGKVQALDILKGAAESSFQC
jgi:hypothetical protein